MWRSAGKVTVVTAGTPIQITSSRTLCQAFTVQQVPGNTGYLLLRGPLATAPAATDATLLGRCAIPTSNILQSMGCSSNQGPNPFDLSQYWLDASVSGEGGIVSYIQG